MSLAKIIISELGCKHQAHVSWADNEGLVNHIALLDLLELHKVVVETLANELEHGPEVITLHVIPETRQ